jgi:hypothetical protein
MSRPVLCNSKSGIGFTTAYAEVKWVPEDIKTLRPRWNLKRCEQWLTENEKYIRDRLTELGWEVIGDLLPPGRKS